MCCCCKYLPCTPSPFLQFFSSLTVILVAFQYPLGIMDARTGYAFPSVITLISDIELMMCLRGQKKGAFQQLPRWPHCAAEGSRATLVPPFLLLLLVTPIHTFRYIQYFPLYIQDYHSPFITALGIY